ncbi:transmembrane protein 44 [Cheilinus undulatus]|uniref:transmembrane protein 44 n=1 Tax=Cheilinus undulatus TaxID=241271 RepID=UPI001BD254A9|nr:transmembrane protein 44 [Cheilinus undulatus]
MEGRKATLQNHDSFLSNLANFCVDSFSTCWSSDADKLCVSIGLSCLSSLLLLLSCFLVVSQRCKYWKEIPGETLTSLCNFLGDLCGTVGAILSRQLHILILMGIFAAAVDAVHVISGCLPVLLCWNSKAVKKRRMICSRRRQHLLSVCTLVVVGGGFLKSRITHRPAETPLTGRKLLHVNLQDNTEVLGYILGLLSFVISCSSRFPALSRAYQGQALNMPHVLSRLLSSLACSLYISAIFLYDTQFVFVLRVLPWLLSAMSCVILDLLILVICWCKNGTRTQLNIFFPDTESLLGASGHTGEDNAVMKKLRKLQVSTARTKAKNTPETTEMGRYMDISVHPARKTCLKEVKLSGRETENSPFHEMVQVIRVNSFSSDSSYISSVESSDLEWDFEEATAKWNEPTARQQERVELPLQWWPAP